MNTFRSRIKGLMWLLTMLVTLGLSAQSFTYQSPTPAHQQVPGTPLWLIPPTGFTLSSQIKGFQHPEYPTASLMVIEVPAPVNLIFQDMTPAALASQEMTLVDADTLFFHERASYRLTVDQQAMGLNIRKHIFAFGDDTQTYLLNVTYALDTEQNLADSLQLSLASLVWQEGTEVDPLAALPYELVQAEAQGWQLAKVMGNAAVYSFDGYLPTEDSTGAILIVDKSVQDIVVYEGEAFCRRRLKNFPEPLMPDEERGFVEVEIDGLKGSSCYAYELAADGSITTWYRMTALFPEQGGYFILMGIAKVDHATLWQKVEQTISSFQRR